MTGVPAGLRPRSAVPMIMICGLARRLPDDYAALPYAGAGQFLRSLDIEAVSLDSILDDAVDDSGEPASSGLNGWKLVFVFSRSLPGTGFESLTRSRSTSLRWDQR
jgi:hypothetical protein